MSTSIATTTSTTATAFSNQRKIDRCQNGILWETHVDLANAVWKFFYSTDNGTTWTDSTDNIALGAGSGGYNGSFFIDLDDNAHFVYKSNFDGFIYYRRGTPNTGRTSWTWSSALNLYASATINYPDIVAHREGTGWKAHVVTSQVTVTPNNITNYIRIDITSGGVLTKEGQHDMDAGYSVSIDTFPSIDFNHNGDGKTVAGSTPHLYVSWSAGKSGTGFGIRFIKAVYSAGAWTWQTEREIDSAVYIPNANNNLWINCLFNGTDVYIVFTCYNGSYFTRIYKRDSTDTTTTLIYDSGALSTTSGAFSGSSSYDTVGNLYIIGTSFDGTRLNLFKCKLSGPTITVYNIGSATSSFPSFSLKRDNSSSRIEWIYTNGTVSPFNVLYSSLIGISTSRTYKWNVKAVLLISRIYKWNVRTSVIPFTRIYKWNVKQLVSLNRVYKWNVIQNIILTRIYQWNVRTIVTPFTRTFLWNVRQLVSFDRTYLWEVFAGWTRISVNTDIWTEINENDASWTPEPINSTVWR